jgi:hypothetical protein
MKPIHAMLVAAALALPAGGCYVYADTDPQLVDYQPLYYEGNVVYYDEVGAPFVYVGDDVVYVPRTYRNYGVLVNHYHRHSRGYYHWHHDHPHARHHYRR